MSKVGDNGFLSVCPVLVHLLVYTPVLQLHIFEMHCYGIYIPEGIIFFTSDSLLFFCVSHFFQNGPLYV